ncbi:hypothetical protein L1987_23799 [Smallanthus sonchifolius]|uniref:Uncharacterized protein n=1 Tax=Smallanthus sonchifolius TaxID=185202 RepID=A0ACB9IHX4_9ASTR|nr:hypothetical protein L1987_23799 [Smallanthus sonchifolius]
MSVTMQEQWGDSVLAANLSGSGNKAVKDLVLLDVTPLKSMLIAGSGNVSKDDIEEMLKKFYAAFIITMQQLVKSLKLNLSLSLSFLLLLLLLKSASSNFIPIKGIRAFSRYTTTPRVRALRLLFHAHNRSHSGVYIQIFKLAEVTNSHHKLSLERRKLRATGAVSVLLGSSIAVKNVVRPIRLPEVKKLPPYTTWIFLDK